MLKESRAIQKVLMYVFHEDLNALLTFTQRGVPEAGRQVPAGTVEPNESVADAATRELTEETGIVVRQDLRPFARSLYDMREFKPEIHERHWFYCVARDFPGSEWTHVECRPGGLCEITADFEWTSFDKAMRGLMAGHQDLLPVAWNLLGVRRHVERTRG